MTRIALALVVSLAAACGSHVIVVTPDAGEPMATDDAGKPDASELELDGGSDVEPLPDAGALMPDAGPSCAALCMERLATCLGSCGGLCSGDDACTERCETQCDLSFGDRCVEGCP